jgi:hypothetical protein
VERTRRKTSVEWPVVVDERLRLLVTLVEQAGHAGTTSASELLAALVCEQSIDGAHLLDKVLRYRQTPHAELSAITHSHMSPTTAPRRGRPRGPRP